MKPARWVFLLAFGAAAAAACFPSIEIFVSDGQQDAGNEGPGEAGPEGSTEGGTLDGDATCSANLDGDPSNCGACGKSCRGGECKAGRCGAVLVAGGLGPPRPLGLSALAVIDETAFLLVDNVLTRIVLSQSPPAVTASSIVARNLDTDGTFLYYLTGKTGAAAVNRVAPTLATAGEEISPPSTFADFIGSGVSAVAYGDNTGLRAVTKGTKLDTNTRVDVDSGLAHVAMGGDTIFYYRSAGGGEIRELALGAVGPGAKANTDQVELDVRQRGDDAGVVWATVSAGKVQVKAPGAPTVVDAIADAGLTFAAVALEPAWVYATTNAPNRLVLRAPRAGGGPVDVIATSTEPLGEIAVSAKYLVWTTRESFESGRPTKQSVWMAVR